MSYIREESSITPEESASFVPKQRYNIPKSTFQKVKSTITSLNSGIVTKNFSQTASTSYDFVIGANNMSVLDLSQCYFNIALDLEFPADLPIDYSDLVLGNLFVSSLFQTATLEMGGTVIALNANPGVDANLQAMLKYDNYDLKSYGVSDRGFMIPNFDFDMNGTKINLQWQAQSFETTSDGVNGVAGAIKIKTHVPQTDMRNSIIYWSGAAVNFANNLPITWMMVKFDDSGNGIGAIYGQPTLDIAIGTQNAQFAVNGIQIFAESEINKQIDKCSVFTPSYEQKVGPDGNGHTVTQPTRISVRTKLFLSDLFNVTVDSLDLVFNREVKITLTRSANSNIICNVLDSALDEQQNANVVASTKFELIAFTYVLTDTARRQLIDLYSHPIDTLYGVQTTNLTPLYQTTGGTEQTITLPLTVNYNTKAIFIAFPKASNPLAKLSTNVFDGTDGPVESAAALAKHDYQMSWFGSTANSYNYAGLKYIRISNTNNASIYTYDFTGTESLVYKPTPFIKSFDYTNVNNAVSNADSHIPDYREAYEQYKNLRVLFSKSPDNGIDYYTFLKDYFVIPIDLTGTNIPPNTRILVTLQFLPWVGDYNPLCYGNYGGQGVNENLNQANLMTTNMLAIYVGSDVLRYNPDGTNQVLHILSANPSRENKAVQLTS